MSEIKFTRDHEWIAVHEDGTATVGITDYAQDRLGDVVYVELPEVGQTLAAGEEAAVVESVKAAGDVKTPAGGEVLEVNESLMDAPETVNLDPTGGGWFFKLHLTESMELEDLLDEAAYETFLKDLD
ncbi:MAG: glycine cleavage system protein GcvH [Planctomycetaceae bacterium]